MRAEKPRILAIDDHPANLMTLGPALGAEFHLQVATSGALGLALAAESPPDLILLDVMMPEMDGYETCRRLKADSRLHAIPVIFVTAMGDTADESAGLALGAADYIIKPINVEITRQRIRNLLEREALRKEVEHQRDRLEQLVLASDNSLTIARQVESELRSLSRAVEQSPAAVMITDRRGNIEYANSQFEKQTGYAIAEVLGCNPRIFKSGRTSVETYRELWQTISAGGEWHGELCNRRKDGELLWESASISGLKDELGQVTHYVAVKEDISLRKKTAEALWQSRQREIEVGSSLQRSLQGEVPGSFEGAWLAVYADPSQGIDGDFSAVRRFSPDCFEVLVGDVMGKGVPAALMGAGIMSAYSNALVELLLAAKDERVLPSPAAIVNAMHRALTPQMMALSSFATLALYRFDLAAGTLTWVNAGHTPGLLTRAAEPRPVAIMGDNLPIGVVPEERYVQNSLAVGPGDSLLVFSDGITEARNAAGEDFGLERLCRLLEPGSRANLPPAIMLQALRGEQRRFTGGGPGTDDLTALMVKLQARRHGLRGGIEERIAPLVFALPWSLEGLAELRRRIQECAGALPAADADGLILASYEVATNAIRHAKLMVGDATLTCRISPGHEALTVELIYPSDAFTPPAEVLADLSGESEGGFGLYIVEQTVDSVEYASPMPGTAKVRLVKRASAVAA